MCSMRETGHAKDEILLVGAGIGGLTAAIALAGQGFAVRLIERSPTLRAQGTGISIQPNASLVLRELGLYQAVAARGAELDMGRMRDERGRQIARLEHHRFAHRYGVSAIGVHRGELIRCLFEQATAAGVKVEFGRYVTGFEEIPEGGVSLEVQDGTPLRGALLIGCDGIWSKVREQLHGASEPRYSGYTCWRGISDLIRPGLNELWGPGLRFGYLPINSKQTYWFAVSNAPPGGEDPPQVLEMLKETFRDWPSEVSDLLAQSSGEILRGDCIDRPPLRWWGKGSVSLLGDAAHAMTPNFGQGACQSMEDAWALAAQLGASKGDLIAGLRSYENLRLARANQFVTRSWSFGRVSHAIQWAPLRRIRDRLLSWTPARIVEKSLDEQFCGGPVSVTPRA